MHAESLEIIDSSDSVEDIADFLSKLDKHKLDEVLQLLREKCVITSPNNQDEEYHGE